MDRAIPNPNPNSYDTKYTDECHVVLTLTCIIKSVVTGQAPVTLELRISQGKTQTKGVVHAYITTDAIHASTKNM